MFEWLRRRLTYANVMSTIAVFAVLGGGAWAAATIGPQDIRRNAVHSRHIKKNAVKTRQIADGAVTNDKLAGDSVTSAKIRDGEVKSADLDPALTASLTLHCPSGLRRAGDLCFENTLRDAAQWPTALKTCARAQLRLPDAGELALVFDHLGAPQESQWIASDFYNAHGFVYGARLSEDASRDILIDPAADQSYTYYPYRCVTSVSN